jgi:hypothetical protein
MMAIFRKPISTGKAPLTTIVRVAGAASATSIAKRSNVFGMKSEVLMPLYTKEQLTLAIRDLHQAIDTFGASSEQAILICEASASHEVRSELDGIRENRKAAGSGYVACACRDCMETAITSDGKLALCSDCEEAGCEAGAEKECCSPHAYGCGENEPQAI